jgi:zinc protease
MGMDLLAEMLRRPTIPETRFEIERKRVLNHIEAMADDPQLIGDQLLNHQIYRDSPLEYPLLGTASSVARLQATALRRFHKEKYGPGNTIITAAGANSFGEVLAQVEQNFGDWENNEQRLTPMWELHRQSEPTSRSKAMNKEQLCIFLGHLGTIRDSPDYYPLQVMDIILGGGPGFASRIPKKLRDEKGLAYTTYSDISGSAGLYPGRFVAFVGTSPDKGNEALSQLLTEITRFVQDGPSPEEVRQAQSFLCGSFVFEFQSNQSLARFLLTTELHSLGRDFPERYKEQILSVTASDVTRVARDYLDTVNYSSVFVGAI